MLAPEFPANEALRQQSLDEQELLDTPADPYLDTLLRVVHELFEVETVLISLIDHDRQWFKARLGLDVAQTPRDQSLCGHAILKDAPLIIDDALADPRFHDNPLVTGKPCLRFYAGQPLLSDTGHALGTLCLLHPTPRRLSERELRLLADMATLVEGYLKLRRVSEQTLRLRDALSREQRKAMLDPLTQLWNRAGLDHFLPQEQQMAQTRGLQLGLLFCDLDHFKPVNDTHGHAVGDQVLWESARRIAAAVRPQDVVTRSGGEEFVVLTQVHDAEELLQIAQRINQSIRTGAMGTEPTRVNLSISIGAALTGTDEAPLAALARADRALYRAKGNGRDQVEYAQDTP
ncbi:MAG: sensor domain-containing diguanylate cyclase [Pseudomonadota bacterium]